MDSRIAAALGGFRERAEAVQDRYADTRETIRAIREQAPTLTTALVLIVFGIGGAAGWYVSKPFTRLAANAEWRAKIAATSASVRDIVATGNAEAEATDDAIIKALGDTDARLSDAERNLKTIRAPVANECRIPADGLRLK